MDIDARAPQGAAPEIAPVRLDAEEKLIMRDGQRGQIEMRHFANIEKADTMGWEQLEDFYHAENQPAPRRILRRRRSGYGDCQRRPCGQDGQSYKRPYQWARTSTRRPGGNSATGHGKTHATAAREDADAAAGAPTSKRRHSR